MRDRLELEPRLVEEAVWMKLRAGAEPEGFHRERERLYEEADPEARERAFERFYGSWFQRFGLAEPLLLVLTEQREGLAPVRRLLVARAVGRNQERAELFVAGREERSVAVWVRPETLAAHERAVEFFRRELTHVADMLDPAFGYEPRLPSRPDVHSIDPLLREHYRVLWDCSVDGRLAREGRLGERVREERLEGFARHFACLGDRVEECFRTIFDGPRPSHRELAAMAEEPAAAFRLLPSPSPRVCRCPLCGFPASRSEVAAATPPDDLQRSIRADFPSWRAEQGLCLQCADLYRARSPSAAAKALAPGEACKTA